MEIIPAVAGNKTNINSAEFVKLTIYNDVNNPTDISVYTFSSSFKAETINDQIYSPMGGLLAVGIQQRDIRVTSADTSLMLSGISGDNIYVVLANKIRGSRLDITRGFYNNQFVMTSTAHRFTGIVTSYNISEERHDLVDNYTVTLNASSFRYVLENRVAGRKTNKESWQSFYPGDGSLNNLYSISDQQFDFGMPVTKSTATGSTASVDASQVGTNQARNES
ncbi:MAG: hypothetical protein ACOVLB_02690 [Candidatus Nanopelagicus sp.]